VPQTGGEFTALRFTKSVSSVGGMGNNAAFTSFEASVMACYNKGVLDVPLLNALMEPYRDMDIDSGGMVGTLSKKDKLDVVDVVLKVHGKKLPPKPKIPKDYKMWTPEEDAANEKWQDAKWDAFDKITNKFEWC
jgi:hypothetical protein